MKHKARKNDRLGAIGNVADEVLEVMSIVIQVDFAKKAVCTDCNNKTPLFICYTTDQMKDMLQFLKSDSDHIFGIDKTVNLGAVYVANFVNKNKKVVNKEKPCHPIFVGTMFLHWGGSFLSYQAFLSHI